jgi:hypothetical protein
VAADADIEVDDQGQLGHLAPPFFPAK